MATLSSLAGRVCSRLCPEAEIDGSRTEEGAVPIRAVDRVHHAEMVPARFAVRSHTDSVNHQRVAHVRAADKDQEVPGRLERLFDEVIVEPPSEAGNGGAQIEEHVVDI